MEDLEAIYLPDYLFVQIKFEVRVLFFHGVAVHSLATVSVNMDLDILKYGLLKPLLGEISGILKSNEA